MFKKIYPISVIIPTLKRTTPLFETIDSILKCNSCPKQIIISDQNDSNLFELIEKYLSTKRTENADIKFDHLKLKKQGSSYGRNFALPFASSEIVVFSDDDVIYEGDVFKNVFERMKDNNITMIGGINYNSPTKKPFLSKLIRTFFGLDSLSINKGKVTPGLFGVYPAKIKKIIKTEWAMGYFIVLNKSELLKSAILFDEELTKYGYAEDLDFSHRFYIWSRKNNKKCILDPTIGVRHMVSNQNRLDKKDLYFKVFANRQYINFKLHKKSLIRLLLLWWSNICYVLICKRQDKNDSVVYAYKQFKLKKSQIKNGSLHF